MIILQSKKKTLKCTTAFFGHKAGILLQKRISISHWETVENPFIFAVDSKSFKDCNLCRMTFDITIPVLNEEQTLEQNVNILHTFVKKHFPSAGQWQIVIADNGSTDRTLEIAKALSESIPEVTFVKVPKKGSDWP